MRGGGAAGGHRERGDGMSRAGPGPCGSIWVGSTEHTGAGAGAGAACGPGVGSLCEGRSSQPLRRGGSRGCGGKRRAQINGTAGASPLASRVQGCCTDTQAAGDVSGGNESNMSGTPHPPQSCCQSTAAGWDGLRGWGLRTQALQKGHGHLVQGHFGVGGFSVGDTVLLITVGSGLEQRARRETLWWGVFQTPDQENMDEAFLRQLEEVQLPYGWPQSSQGPSTSPIPARRAAQKEWSRGGSGWGCHGVSGDVMAAAAEVSTQGAGRNTGSRVQALDFKGASFGDLVGGVWQEAVTKDEGAEES